MSEKAPYILRARRPENYAEGFRGPWVAEVFVEMERVAYNMDCWTQSGALRWGRRQARRHAAGKLDQKPNVVEQFTP